MLDAALLFFQEELSNYIKIKTGGQKENAVQFAEIQAQQGISMPSNGITALLISLEEERLFRSSSSPANYLTHGNQPEEIPNLCLNFHLMFIANFQSYVEGVRILSLVLKFFRSYRVFDQRRFPALSTEIYQLSTELVNLSFMEQGELWRSLELPCSPSVLYKVRMIIFRDSEIDIADSGAELSTIQTTTAQIFP